MVNAFSGATRASPNTKAISVEQLFPVLTFPLRKATALKTSCELSPNMCGSSRSTLLEVTSRNHELTKCSQFKFSVQKLGYNYLWEKVIPLLAVQSPYVFQQKSGYHDVRSYETKMIVNRGDEAENNSLNNSSVCVTRGASDNNKCIRVAVPFEAKYV